MWIKWIHYYYVKKQIIMTMVVKSNTSWILKTILKHIQHVMETIIWNQLLQAERFQTRSMYEALKNNFPKVGWKNVMAGNYARPRALFILWLACHGRMATKDILYRFRMITTDVYCFCSEKESLSHVFFQFKDLIEI